MDIANLTSGYVAQIVSGVIIGVAGIGLMLKGRGSNGGDNAPITKADLLELKNTLSDKINGLDVRLARMEATANRHR